MDRGTPSPSPPLPVTVLSRLFRGKFLAALARAWECGDLRFPVPSADLAADFGHRDLVPGREALVPHGIPGYGGEPMARRLARVAVVGSLFMQAAPAAWANCMAILKATESAPFIQCMLGIEQWENGKRSESRYQQWDLSCQTPPSGQTSCRLERVIFTLWSKTMGGTSAAHDTHSTDDGTLRLIDGRWRNGSLDFDVVTTSWAKDVVHVAMRFEIKDPLVTLESFKAVGVGRSLFSGELSTIEYRVPDYTYTVSVPITLEGVKSETDKRYDEMLNGLSVDDRRAWDHLRDGRCVDFGKAFERQILEQLPANLRNKAKTAKKDSDLTPEEKARLKAASLAAAKQYIDRCLREAGMSEAGRARVGGSFLAEPFD